jgi:hypothetical protein
MDSERSESFDVGLNPSTSAGIRASYRESALIFHMFT